MLRHNSNVNNPIGNKMEHSKKKKRKKSCSQHLKDPNVTFRFQGAFFLLTSHCPVYTCHIQANSLLTVSKPKIQHADLRFSMDGTCFLMARDLQQ